MLSDFVTVAKTKDLRPGERIVVEINEVYVAVFNVGGKYYAIEDVCTHDDGELAEGPVNDTDSENPTIECPRHGATFNLKTGKPTFPAVVPVPRFQVRVEDDEVQVNIDEEL
jgi:3-phenylpropionate/trans-cinnamate dioxygenase ferredoxin subunit